MLQTRRLDFFSSSSSSSSFCHSFRNGYSLSAFAKEGWRCRNSNRSRRWPREEEALLPGVEAPRGKEAIARFLRRSFRKEEWDSETLIEYTRLRAGLHPRLLAGALEEALAREKDPMLALRMFRWAQGQRGYRHGAQAYYALLCTLGDARHFDLCWKTVKAMRTQGVAAWGEAFLILVRCYGQAGMPLEAIGVLQRVREFGYRANYYLYNCVLGVLVRQPELDMALDVYNQMLREGCSPNTLTLNLLVKGFCRSGRVEDARKMIETAGAGMDADVITYNTLVSGYCKAKQLSDAMLVLKRMKDSGPRPDIVTYNSLMHGLCEASMADEALELLNEMLDCGIFPDATTYNTLVLGLCNCRRLEEAEGLISVMAKNGCPPDIYTLNTLLNGQCAAREIRKALNTLQTLETGLGLVPDVYTYNILIKGFCRAGELEEARRVLQTMKRKQSALPDLITYSTLIHSLCLAGDTLTALGLFNEMIESGLRPDSILYSALMDGLCRAGRVGEAMKLHKWVGKFVNPNTAAYTALINSVCHGGDGKQALKLLHEMQDAGCVPNPTTYNSLIAGLCQAGEYTHAFDLWETMKKKSYPLDPLPQNLLAKALCESGDLDHSFQLFQELKKSDRTFNTYIALISSLCKHERANEAAKILDNMLVNHLTPPIATFNEVLAALLQSGEWNPSDSKMIIRDIIRKGSLPNAHTYNLLIGRLCDSGDMISAYELLDEMKSKGCTPDDSTFSCLIRGFCLARNMDKAFKLFQRMLRKKRVPEESLCEFLKDHLVRWGRLAEARAVDGFLVDLERGRNNTI